MFGIREEIYVNKIKIPPRNKRNKIREGKESRFSLYIIITEFNVWKIIMILKGRGWLINGVKVIRTIKIDRMSSQEIVYTKY